MWRRGIIALKIEFRTTCRPAHTEIDTPIRHVSFFFPIPFVSRTRNYLSLSRAREILRSYLVLLKPAWEVVAPEMPLTLSRRILPSSTRITPCSPFCKIKYQTFIRSFFVPWIRKIRLETIHFYVYIKWIKVLRKIWNLRISSRINFTLTYFRFILYIDRWKSILLTLSLLSRNLICSSRFEDKPRGEPRSRKRWSS